MDTPKPAAERVRSIIQAMERTIDAARRERLNVDDEPPTQVRGSENPQPGGSDARLYAPGSHRSTHTAPQPERDPMQIQQEGEDAPRLKARPKRATPYPPLQGDTWRSRAS